MTVLALLERLRDALAAALPQAAVVSVHAQDLSDAQTGKWMVRLPGIYLTCEAIEARVDEASARLRLYVLARLADLRREPATDGWALAESALAVLAADAAVARARLIYRDQAGLDQPGIALWEIEAEARHRPAIAAPADGLRAETILASWAPWIGAAHVSHYRPVRGEDAAPGVSLDERLP